MLLFSAFIFLAVALVPTEVLAWGPAAHLHYGTLILEQSHLLVDSIRILLSQNVSAYLYGTISADIVLIKKLGKEMDHCHRWDKGIELLDSAQTPRKKAFALGYLSHLASDCISHNCFVPSKTIESSDFSMMKHVYWEVCFDQWVTTPQTHALFRQFVDEDFSDCDSLFEENVSMRIGDFGFNKKVFDHMIKVQGLKRWQFLVDSLSTAAKFPLSQSTVDDFTQRSVDAIRSFLNERENAWIVGYDPQGEARAQEVKRMRKEILNTPRKLRIEIAQDFSEQMKRLPAV